MKFRLLLFVLSKILIRASKKNPRFRKLALKNNAVFQLQTKDGKVARHFIVKNGAFFSAGVPIVDPDFSLNFEDKAYGFSVLTSKDPKAFINGILEEKITVQGDFSLVIWFQNLIGLARSVASPPPPDLTPIGFVGTGMMGAPMIRALLRNGFDVRAHDIDADVLKIVEEDGAVACRFLQDLADVKVLVVMVNNMRQVEEVVLGFCQNLPSDRQTPIVVMSTVSPDDLLALRQKLDQWGKASIPMLDAPVSGAALNAEAGKLSIMAGGDRSLFESIKPIFDAVGSSVSYMGDLGKGSATKLVNNILGLTAGINTIEAMHLAARKGLDPDETIRVINQSTGQNFLTLQWPMTKKLLSMMLSDTTYGAKEALFNTGRKDLETAKKWAETTGITVPCVDNSIDQVSQLTSDELETMLKKLVSNS